ncbi:hypothetical protein SK128_006302, partial [Halocaridina rubra]
MEEYKEEKNWINELLERHIHARKTLECMRNRELEMENLKNAEQNEMTDISGNVEWVTITTEFQFFKTES